MGSKSFEKMGMFENFVRFFDESEHAPNVNQKLQDFFQVLIYLCINIYVYSVSQGGGIGHAYLYFTIASLSF
jgi:hypothetical protein